MKTINFEDPKQYFDVSEENRKKLLVAIIKEIEKSGLDLKIKIERIFAVKVKINGKLIEQLLDPWQLLFWLKYGINFKDLKTGLKKEKRKKIKPSERDGEKLERDIINWCSIE